MPPRRVDFRSATLGAESRYARYSREIRTLIQDAEHEGHNGNWTEAGNKLSALLTVVGAQIGVTHELNLYYLARTEEE